MWDRSGQGILVVHPLRYFRGIMPRPFVTRFSGLLAKPFPWVLLIGCAGIMATFLHLTEGDLDWFFSSDTLYLPALYRDLFQHGGHITDWSLNAAPNFFPDMGLFFLLNWIFGSFQVAFFIYPMVQFVIIACLFRAIVRESGIPTDAQALSLGVLLLALVPLTGWWGGDFGFAFHLLVNSFHTAAFVNALLCTWLLLRLRTRRGAWPWVLLGAACALGSISDRLFWITFTTPATLACLAMALRSKRRWKWVAMAGLVIVTTVLSYQGLILLQQAFPLTIENPYAYLAFDRILFSWGRFLDMLDIYLTGHALVIGTVVVGLLATMAVMVYGILRMARWMRATHAQLADTNEGELMVVWMTALFMPMVLLAPVANGSFDGMDSLRYNFYGFALAPLLVGLWLGRRLGGRVRVPLLVGSVLIGVPVLAACLVAGSARYNRLWHYKPASVQQFDKITEGLGLRNGVAKYWDAKRIMMFSDQDLMVVPVFPDLATYVHVNRPTMFYDSTFNFAVVDPQELRKEDLARIFEQDTGFHAGEGWEVLVTPPWTYDRETHRPAVNAP